MVKRCVSSAFPLFSCLNRFGMPMISNSFSQLNVEIDAVQPTVNGPTSSNLHYELRIVNTQSVLNISVRFRGFVKKSTADQEAVPHEEAVPVSDEGIA